MLVLHGGRAESRRASRPWHLAALRMRPFVRDLVAAAGPADVLVAQVRYRHRGWNGEPGDPVADVRRALAELEAVAGGIPVVLVGHSMGGRAALRAADDPRVRAVVALAPWCPPGEPVGPSAGKRVVVLHGSRDRVTSAAESAAFVRRARAAGAHAAMALVDGGDHGMLRRHRHWHRVTTEAVGELLEPDARPSVLPGGAWTAAEPPRF
ncbi:alpha/beta fold hydrolase [Streptomyces sp. K1PA1]|uniref:Alpha/beta fold hydrolase n=1 Tax=Streptomyces tropicalis TaxID=3034234 RepID=A0ABT6AA01_9ACTN|nr:alpha/beta fold hydrolase [Streptomyces tropicalis]MDF3301486.1 alpha/beta fold hydrolase [Streptomyces tropicalis]